MKPLSPGFLTSEFWVKLPALSGAIITFLISTNVIKTSDPNSLIQALSNVLIGVGTIVGLIWGSTSYANNRTKLKMAAVQSLPATHGSVVIDTRTGR